LLAQTSKRLTIFFTVLMIVFLLLMNVLSYLILSSMIYKDQNAKLEAVVISEMSEHSNELLESQDKAADTGNNYIREGRDRTDHQVETPLRPFYMLLDHEGHILRTDAVDDELAQSIKDNLKDWIPKEKETLHHVYNIEKENVHLMLAGRAFYREGVYVGSVIAGIDITEQQKVLKQVTVTEVIVSLLFLLVSIVFADVMSRRAMQPIIRSFGKQQRFTADASHELRTPLTVLHSSIEVLESETEGLISPFGKQVMDDMKDEIRRMTRLVSDLLTLAQADASVVEHKYEEFALDVELERAFRNFQPMAQIQGIDLKRSAATRAIVRADLGRLQQLLVILLDNAVQYTPAGSHIIMNATVKGNMLTLSIQDSGVGIPEDKLNEVFERFSRVDESRNRSQAHAGLGLSIAKWIVESHRGSIEVESKLGVGSTFVVNLPIVIYSSNIKI